MTSNPEFRVHSIAFGPEGIDLVGGIESNPRLTGQLSIVQIRCSRELTRECLGLLANVAFGIRPLKPEEIFEDDSLSADQDAAFAAQFGFTLIPRLAHLGKAADGAIEAWISPALVPNHHPLASHETYLLPDLSPRVRFPNGGVVLGLNQLTIARYLRLTVEDRSSVLGEILAVVAQLDLIPEEQINIHEILQPEPEKGNPTVHLAILLNACPSASLSRALGAIRTLPSCRSIDAVLPVIGLGRHDLLPT